MLLAGNKGGSWIAQSTRLILPRSDSTSRLDW